MMLRFHMRQTGIAVILCVAAAAQVPAPRPSETSTPAVPPKRGEGVRPLTAEDLHAFIDGLLPIQLDRSDEAGAVVEVVRGDDVLLEKGYGYSDVKKKMPVDPAVSGFRPGSISKLFTWISIMQLRDAGKLDLDTDVNRYLDFTVPRLTIRDLMTHRPGFEEEIRDLIRAAPAPFIPLRQYLIDNQPAQVFRPGTVPAYSNYGAGLAGYIVQRTSGERFEDYVRRHIFEPLAMSRSSFEQPLPKNWPVHPAAGYGRAENKMLPFEIVEPAPAGALTSTGADMVRFARALLHGGELDGHRILQAETLQEMWKPQFRANPALPAMCLGFYQQLRDGTIWVGHGGDLIADHSLLMIHPQSKTAMFISYNSAGTDRGVSIERAEFFNQFVDRYYGPATDLPTVAKNKGTPASEIAGTWWTTRRGVKNRLRLLTLFDQSDVGADKDGNVVSDAKSISDETIHWKPAGRDLWVDPEGQRHLCAIRDVNGRVAGLAADFPAAQMRRVPWYAKSRLNLTLLGISVFCLVCVIWAAVLRLIQRSKLPPAGFPLRRMRRAQVIMSVVWVAILGAVIVAGSALGGPDTFPPSHDFDKWLLLIDVAVGIAIGASVAVVCVTIRLWPALRGLWLRARLLLVALAAVYLIWFCVFWKVIGTVSHF